MNLSLSLYIYIYIYIYIYVSKQWTSRRFSPWTFAGRENLDGETCSWPSNLCIYNMMKYSVIYCNIT